MSTGYSNAVLVADLLSMDGPFGRVADDFVAARCARCSTELAHDPRYGEWGAYCSNCWVESQTA